MNEYGLNIYTVSIPIITGFIAYLSSRHQFNVEFKKVKEQCETDIKKIEEQCKSDIKKLKEQCDIDIKKLEKQSQAEIEKIKIESDKQSDLYEKNKKTDMYSTILSRVIDNPEETIETITKVNEKSEVFNKFDNLITNLFSSSTKNSNLAEIACDEMTDTGEVFCDRGINNLEIRGLQTLISKEVNKQVNIENIIVKAREFIKEKESVSDEPVEQDWITRFFNIAQDVSDDEMQNLWAKILSDEIEKPKSYSLRTLEVVKNLSREEAKLITKFCELGLGSEGFVCIIGNNEFLKKKGIEFIDRIKLEELNIAKFDLCIKLETNDKIYLIYGRNAIRIENEGEYKELPVINFSGIGQDIYKIVKKDFNMAYMKEIAEFIKSKGVYNIKLVDVYKENNQYIFDDDNAIDL